jgi:predicted phosphodiesterase
VKKDKSKKATKEEIVYDLQEVAKKYREEFGENELVTRNYYRQNGRYKDKEIERLFGNFENLKKETFNTEINTISLKKKIHVLENTIQLLEKENKNLIKSSINEDIILDIIKDKISYVNFPNKICNAFPKSKNTIEAVLLVSDIHCGEVINPEEIGFINAYNIEIMKKRLERIFYYFAYYCSKFEITKAHILFLGDLFSGNHQDELIRTNEVHEVDALFLLQELITQQLLKIESKFQSIECEFVVGNHSRIPIGKLQYKSAAKLNYEYILSKQLQQIFEIRPQQQKIKINTCNSLFKVKEIAGRKFLMTHGHTLSKGSNSFASIPYYGLSMSAAKLYGALLQSEVEEDTTSLFQDILMAHLHTSARVKITSGNLYINGAIIGTSDFSLYKMNAISKPEQTMLFVDEGYVINEIILRGED